jgi:hypothetical protein
MFVCLYVYIMQPTKECDVVLIASRLSANARDRTTKVIIEHRQFSIIIQRVKPSQAKPPPSKKEPIASHSVSEAISGACLRTPNPILPTIHTHFSACTAPISFRPLVRAKTKCAISIPDSHDISRAAVDKDGPYLGAWPSTKSSACSVGTQLMLLFLFLNVTP